MSKKKKTAVKSVIILLMITGVVFAGHTFLLQTVHKLTNVSVEFGSEFDEEESSSIVHETLEQQEKDIDLTEFENIEKAIPFKELEIFGEDAQDWSSFFDGYAACGVLVFDANGDDKLDIYFCRNGNSWIRPSDSNATLINKPHPQYNTLYINLGNDSLGDPVFKPLNNLVSKNNSFQKEELLIENYLFPRDSALSSRQGLVGRASSCAVSADINNDGRPDLLVGNILPGMLWSHPKTQRVLGQFVRPVGREAVKTKLPLTAQGLYFLKDYAARDERNDKRKSSRGEEYFGANSIFLNMGDQDGDSIPEWKDVSKELNLEGRRNTMALMLADFDLDGDLDVYEANIMDMDYWPGGSTELAGAANQLFVNQLAETGKLNFIEKSAELNVDGVYDAENPAPDYYKLWKIPILPEEYSIALRRFIPYSPGFLKINDVETEHGQISWAAVIQDYNDDGYPDIWVANDLGFLRLYENLKGKGFKQNMDHSRASKSGYWMSLSPADFNNDLSEDLFAGNIGGGAMNLSLPIPDLYMLFDPVLTSSTMAQQFFGTAHHSMHAIYDGASLCKKEMENKVRHSSILPPDASMKNNIRTFVVVGNERVKFDPNSIDPYEFTWGSTAIDVQNDGLQDVYWIGCLQGRGGGIFPIMGTGPGRLLVNATKSKDKLRFYDLTGEHRLFNIHELQYDSLESKGYIYRNSPLQNWGKRSVVTSHDLSVWGFQGPGIIEKITNHDMIQTAENGRAAIAADINNDGYADIIVRNMGGYDSRRSNSRNLKAKINGKAHVIPAHDANFPSPTNYEPGSSRLFINQYTANNWIKVHLIDDEEKSYNRNAIGAKIIANGKYFHTIRAGSGGFISNYCGPVLIGLAEQKLQKIKITWPDKNRTVTEIDIENLSNGILYISKTKGLLQFKSSETKLEAL